MPATTKSDTATAVLAAVMNKPGSTAAELAGATELGRSTVAKALAALEKKGRVLRARGTHDGAHRAADTWTPCDTTTGPDGSSADSTTSLGAGGVTRTDTPSTTPETNATGGSRVTSGPRSGVGASTRGRLRKGELNGLVLSFLAEHGQPVTASAIGKAIGRSGGAVANALVRMETAGQVTRVTDKPRTYQPAST